MTESLKYASLSAMKPQQAIDFFGTRTKLAETLGVTDTAIGQWVKQGWIYYERQCQIQVESEKLAVDGKEPLVASWDDIPEERRKVAA